MAILISGKDFMNEFTGKVGISFDFTYFENIYQNIALAIFCYTNWPIQNCILQKRYGLILEKKIYTKQ